MRKWIVAVLCVACFVVAIPASQAQAVYTADRASRIEAGVGAMYLNNDYTARRNYGLTVWGDYDWNRLIGFEGEARFGGLIAPDDIGENSYLVGPTVSYRRRKYKVYGKLLFGRATISNQLYNTSSSFNLYAFGGGLNYRLSRRFSARGDFEIQKWPDFEPNTLSPLAITVGVMYRIH